METEANAAPRWIDNTPMQFPRLGSSTMNGDEAFALAWRESSRLHARLQGCDEKRIFKGDTPRPPMDLFDA